MGQRQDWPPATAEAGGWQGMGSYLRAIWQCRFFWLSLVKMDLRTRYRRSILGMGWSLLHPILMTAVICTMMHKFLGMDLMEYGPFLMAGFACWNYILNVTNQGCQSLFLGESYIRQHPAPMAIYPLRTALGVGIHFLLALLVVLIMSWCLHGFGNAPALIALVPAVVLLLVFGWALAVLAAFANVYFQDTQHLTEIFFQLLFYASPIIYSEKMLEKHDASWLIHFNPVVAFLRMIRQPILDGQIPSLNTFLAATGVVTIAVIAASVTLVRLQRRVIFNF
jgi:ABC-type polysaccharide/polyol phosphate export permease